MDGLSGGRAVIAFLMGALAPEREGVEDFVRTVLEEGVTVALGHSNATFDEA